MTVKIVVGNALEELKKLPDRSIQAWITSPPYWGLRCYDTESLVWGGDPECEHIWGESVVVDSRGLQTDTSTLAGPQVDDARKSTRGQFCQLCGAWLGSLGLEPTPELYIQHLVEIFREARRVLRDDGVLWLNLADSYAGSWRNYGAREGNQRSRIAEHWHRPAYEDDRDGWNGLPPTAVVPDLKPKDLVGIPWRVAFALQADGWYLRSDIIWHKPNSMPESVTDRPTKAHEYVFLLSKSQHYFYDGEAIKEESTRQTGQATNFKRTTKECLAPNQNAVQHREERIDTRDNGTRNKRTVWTIPSHPFKGSHFATFPPALVEPMIKASTSEEGRCPTCGAAWGRVVEKPDMSQRPVRSSSAKYPTNGSQYSNDDGGTLKSAGQQYQEWRNANPNVTLGWSPTCNCPPHDPVPCIVGDMFGGAGTVGLVADRLGRDALLIELNPDYAEMARQRITEDAGPMLLDLEIIEESDGNPVQQLELFG